MYFIENRLAYIVISEEREGAPLYYEDTKMDMFGEATLAYLKENNNWVYSKNKVHIYFPDLCMFLRCFENKKDAKGKREGKRITIFEEQYRCLLEESQIKLG